jgi:LETM1 and EF-hand domain-containing protein 1
MKSFKVYLIPKPGIMLKFPLARQRSQHLSQNYSLNGAELFSFIRFFSKNSLENAENNSALSDTIRSLTSQGLPDKIISKPEIKKPIMVRLKEGLQHYWHGSKLLAYETKISTKLLYKMAKGDNLIRREKRQLLRTTSDLLRLVPFIIIAIIPFLEFAIPVLLKIFPNMLPSTFEDKVTAVLKNLIDFCFYSLG